MDRAVLDEEKIKEILELVIYWISEKQPNRLLEEAEWFDIHTNRDLLFGDLLNVVKKVSSEDLMIRITKYASREKIEGLYAISNELDDLKQLDNKWEEKVYSTAVGILSLLKEDK